MITGFPSRQFSPPAARYVRDHATAPVRRRNLLRWVLLGAGFTCLIGLGVPLDAQAQGQVSRSLERIATEMVDLFPKVEGDVVKVEGNQVFITLGASDNMREGMTLSVVRKGDEFKHPLTGAVLGRFEDELGVLVVSKVSEAYSSGPVRLTKSNVNVRTGDRVRITKGKIPVAVLPLQGEAPSWVSGEELTE